jgi:hypothetical protein
MASVDERVRLQSLEQAVLCFASARWISISHPRVFKPFAGYVQAQPRFSLGKRC